MLTSRTFRRPAKLATWLLLGVSAALALLGGRAVVNLNAENAQAVPWPIYEIIATSGDHKASLLNLKMGQPGVPQVPIPVDIDGDLLPDVTVAVNLVNVDGALQNPPVLGEVIAPNIEINRLATAAVLNQATPPLRIQAKLTIKDMGPGATKDDTIVHFGYETPVGGSIPQNFNAVLFGIDKFFNPLQAVVRTDGIPGDKFDINTIDDQGSHYAGPLDLIGNIKSETTEGKFTADLDLAYDPWPEAVSVRYEKNDVDDEVVHQIDYRHGAGALGAANANRYAATQDIDLDAKVLLDRAGVKTDLHAVVERLPRALDVDLRTGDEKGTLTYAAPSDGRRPDIGVDFVHRATGKRPVHVKADIEALPTALTAAWAIPPDATEETPLTVDFTAADGGIGAIEGEYRNYDTATHTFENWVSPEVQYVDFQRAAGESPEMRARFRVERVREMSVRLAGDTVDTHTDLGNGQKPLAALVKLHGVGTETLSDARIIGIVSPLPAIVDSHIELPPEGSAPGPMSFSYDASSAVDADVHAELRPHESILPCGLGATLCADIALRNLPEHIDVNITPKASEVFFDVDSEPREGAPALDVFGDLVAGPLALGDFGQPLVAHVELQGMPDHMTARVHKDADGVGFDAIEFHGCDWIYAAKTCVNGTAGDQIAQVDLTLRTMLQRPADLPALVPTAPLYATVLGRGDKFEVVGHLVEVEEVQLAMRQDVIGLRTDIGGGKPLQLLADVEDLDLNKYIDDEDEETPALPVVDIQGKVLVNPLPPVLDICVRTPGARGPAVDDFTTPCQNTDPFDGAPPINGNPKWLTYAPGETPLSIAYDASDSPDDLDPFAVTTDFELVAHDVQVDPDVDASLTDTVTVRGHVGIEQLPETFVAHACSSPTTPAPDPSPCATTPPARPRSRSTSTSPPNSWRVTESARTPAT